MGFWSIAAAMALVVAAVLIRALMRGGDAVTSAATFDLQVYRDQLRDVEKDLARGVIGTEDAARLRNEVSRRVLEADRALAGEGTASSAPKGATAVMIAVVGLILAGSFLAYERLGAPGYPDLSLKTRIAMADELRKTRPSQATVEAQVQPDPQAPAPDPKYLELMEKLRIAVAQRPGDLQGQMLLARNEAALGNFVAAHQAQAKVIAIRAGAADAEDYSALADLMVLAAGGYVSPEAEVALTEALRRDPRNGTARYYSGLMFAQTGRPDLAFRLWRPLLEDSKPDDLWFAPLRAQIEDMAVLAGVEYTLPPGDGLRGPSAGDVAAAADMTAEDRQQMIRGMVAQLNERLATEGGTAEEWARLIGAYGVLGEAEKARAIWAEAQGHFTDRPDDLAKVRAAAVQAGIAE